MITYAERTCFSPTHLLLLKRVQDLVDRVSDAWGNELRCHELVRAVHRVVHDRTITVVDGHCGPVEHSWLQLSDGAILDPYAPGRLPAVQVIDQLIGAAYRPSARRQDVRREIVDRLVAEMRRASDHDRHDRSGEVSPRNARK